MAERDQLRRALGGLDAGDAGGGGHVALGQLAVAAPPRRSRAPSSTTAAAPSRGGRSAACRPRRPSARARRRRGGTARSPRADPTAPGGHRSPAIARSKPTQITFIAVVTICSRVTSGWSSHQTARPVRPDRMTVAAISSANGSPACSPPRISPSDTWPRPGCGGGSRRPRGRRWSRGRTSAPRRGWPPRSAPRPSIGGGIRSAAGPSPARFSATSPAARRACARAAAGAGRAWSRSGRRARAPTRRSARAISSIDVPA